VCVYTSGVSVWVPGVGKGYSCTHTQGEKTGGDIMAPVSHFVVVAVFFILGWNWRGGVGGGVVGGWPPALSHPLSRVRAKVVRIRNFRFVLLWSLLSGQMLPRIGESTPKWGWKRVKWGKGGRVKSVEVDANKVAFCCCFGVCCLIRLVNDSQWAHWLA